HIVVHLPFRLRSVDRWKEQRGEQQEGARARDGMTMLVHQILLGRALGPARSYRPYGREFLQGDSSRSSEQLSIDRFHLPHLSADVELRLDVRASGPSHRRPARWIAEQ